MTSRNAQSRWRAALFAALCGTVAVITVESPAKLHAQAPAGPVAGGGRGAVPPAEALFTSAQAVAGRASYQRNCASCHGANVDDGNTAPPLRGAAFLGKYAGKPAADLFTYVSTKMPPGNPGSLGGAEVAQIIAYVLQQNGIRNRTTRVRIGFGRARFRDDSRSAGRTRRRGRLIGRREAASAPEEGQPSG